MAGPEFVHLHVHSQYSMLDGAVKVKDLVKRVAKDGMKAIAVTDHGNMFGAISFYKAAKEAGVQAIIGCEVEVADRGRARHLPLIAATSEGYKNLVKLVSMGHVKPEPDGPAGVPTISLDTIAQHSKGIIAMTGCMGGVAAQAILEEGEEAGKKALARMKEIFEPGSLYVELQDHGLPEQPILNDILLQHARFFELPSVATNDVHFANRDDAQAHLYLSCIETKRTYAEALERHHGSSEMYLKSPIEMAELFSGQPSALKATLEIAERCKALKLKLNEPMLPNFTVPDGYDTEGYFREVARKGLERRFEEIGNVDRDKYRARLEMELDVISKMKFPGYFLIVWDFIRYAKESGIPVGPGRGSGAGSIVAYAMRITDLDPIPLDLLFERFLNPERISMPDFDVDFCMDKRDRVIAYVQKKYGEESVGQIATFAELKAKSVIKDVGRTIGMLPVEQQALANLIPRKNPAETYTIQESLQIEPKLKARYETEPQIRECLDQASKLEGLIRQVGKHAAGIVISEGALWDHVPVFKDPTSGSYVTQYYKDDVEAAGLVKFDFLGLKTLTVLDIATILIRSRAAPSSSRPDAPLRVAPAELFDLARIPLDDKATFAFLASGETKGVFQLESSGMQQLFKDLKADCFEDIVAAVALYRPGPLGSGMVTDFVNRKNKRAKVESLHAKVDAILVPTYGVIVYQEQVMQVAQALAGYTLGGADILRRAMGKKKPEEMAKQKGIFVEGALKNGVTQDDAERIFGLLEFFAGYGFNKCVVGATEIMDARTGERTTVRDLFERRRSFSVHALGEDGKLRARRVTDVMSNGRKRVLALTTAQGKRITATANHPFRTLNGWKNLGDLRVGDRIAAPRRLGVATSARWPAHELIALAGLLSEGNTCHPTCLYFFGNEKKLVDDFAAASAQFPSSVARQYQRPNDVRYEVCVSTAGQVPWNARGAAAVAVEPVRSGMFEWARELGILGKKATEKDVPDPVFALADEDIELFLGRLWAGDGFIANATQFTPFYATSSRALAKSVQTLLLRLGITSGIHEKTFRYRGGERAGFTVHLVGDGAAVRFVERVAPHCVGREGAVDRLRAHLASTPRGLTSKDTVPREITEWVDEDRRAAGLTWKELEARSGVCVKELCGPSKVKKAFRRSTIAAVGRALGSERLESAAASDVFWDRIVSIEDAGVEETFDLTVDVDHNFVADGLCVHNSHSAAYALITYQTAWLKTHYPAELLCAILTSDKDKNEKVVRTIADARAMGITVLPPDINESDTDFKVVYGEESSSKKRRRVLPQIRFGLGAVRGVGGAALESIFEARKSGKFIDLFDFASRVDAAKINKAVLQALVQCGAFDSTFGALGTSRAQAYASIDVALERLRAATRDRERGQTNLFGLFDSGPSQKWNAPSAGDYVEAAPWDRKEMLTRERQSLGFYVSGHPLERYLKGGSALARLEALPASTCNDQQDWAVVKLAGMVEGYRERVFRDGASSNKLAFFELEDLSGRVQVKVRGNQIDSYAHVLTSGEPILVTGKVSFPRRDEDEPEPDADTPREATILLNDAVLLSDVVAASSKQVLLRLHADQIREGTLDKMSRVMRESPGSCGVSVHLVLPTGAEATLSLGPSHRVEIGDALLAGLERIFGTQVAELR